MRTKLITLVIILLITLLFVSPVLAEGNRNGLGGPPSNGQPNDSDPTIDDSQPTDSDQMIDNGRHHSNGNGNQNTIDQQDNNRQPNSNGQQTIVILGQIISIGTESITIQVLNGNVGGKIYIMDAITVSTNDVDFYQWTEEGCVPITDLEATLEEGTLVNVHGSLNEEGEIVISRVTVDINCPNLLERSI